MAIPFKTNTNKAPTSVGAFGVNDIVTPSNVQKYKTDVTAQSDFIMKNAISGAPVFTGSEDEYNSLSAYGAQPNLYQEQTDLERIRAKNQSAWEQAFNSLAQATGQVIGDAVGGFGMLADIITGAAMDEDLYSNLKKKSKLNIFRDYISFLNKINECESNLKDSLGYEFIKFIETTSMSKTYKLPVLLAFYNNGNMKLKINDEDLYKSFKEFYSNGSNGVDMLKDKSTSKFKTWDKKEYVKLARKNPVHFLCKSSSEFFYLDGDYVCLNKELEKFFNNEEFINSVKDAIDFRTKEYYKNRFEHK